MFDFLWTKKNIPSKVCELKQSCGSLMWLEHCVECAMLGGNEMIRDCYVKLHWRG